MESIIPSKRVKKASALYTFLPKENTAEKDGILSTKLAPNGWERYKGWAKGDTKEEVLAAMDAALPGRSSAISVFTSNPADYKGELPANIKRLIADRQLYSMPSYKELKAAGLVTNLYKVIRNKQRTKREVQDATYNNIDWADTVPLEGRNDWSRLPHYLMVTKDGKIPAEMIKKAYTDNADLFRTARGLYLDDGPNQWPHIRRVLAQGRAYARSRKEPLTRPELAALLFHDIGKIPDNKVDGENHAITGGRLVKELLKDKLPVADLNTVATAIEEHDFDVPTSSPIGDLLKSSDANKLNLAWYLRKCYEKNKLWHPDWSDSQLGASIADRVKGGALFLSQTKNKPKLWAARCAEKQPTLQKQIDALTPESAVNLVKEYTAAHPEESLYT